MLEALPELKLSPLVRFPDCVTAGALPNIKLLWALTGTLDTGAEELDTVLGAMLWLDPYGGGAELPKLNDDEEVVWVNGPVDEVVSFENPEPNWKLGCAVEVDSILVFSLPFSKPELPLPKLKVGAAVVVVRVALLELMTNDGRVLVDGVEDAVRLVEGFP